MDWISVGQDRDRWRAVVNAAMNFQIPKNAGNVLTSQGPVRSSGRNVFPVLS